MLKLFKKSALKIEEKGKKKVDEIDPTFQEKPLICLIDVEAAQEELVKNSFNVKSGTLGTIIDVPNSKKYQFHECLINYNIPQNLHEYNIIILNLKKNDIIPYKPEENRKKTIEGNSTSYLASSYPEKCFNPRQFGSYFLGMELSDVLRYKIIIVFADKQKITTYNHMNLTNSGWDSNGRTSKYSNYQFCSQMPKSKNKFGKEMYVDKKSGIFFDLLNRHIHDSTYEIVFNHPTTVDSSRKSILDPNFIPLIKNSDNEIVSFIKFSENELFMFLPQINNKSSILLELLTHQFPSMYPEIFPFNTEFKWLEDKTYSLPNEFELYRKKEQIISKINDEIAQIDDEIDVNHREYEFLHNLITNTGSDLEKTVELFFKYLGFKDVKNMDETNPAVREEDLQVVIDEGLLVIEVKGIGGPSTDSDCSQIQKIRNRRSKERNKFDVYGLYIVNHQRYQPPLSRTNPPFNEQQIQDAISDERGLLTTWQLFNLYFSIEKGIITKEDARKALINFGLIEFTPSNSVPLGKAKEIHYDGKVIILDISTKIKLNQELIIQKDNRYYITKILELKKNDVIIEEAESGEIGMKIDFTVDKLDELFLKIKNSDE